MGSIWDGVHDLIARAKAGDGQAWKCAPCNGRCLPHESGPQRLLGDSWPLESVSDLTQETWQRVVVGLADFAGGERDDQTGPMFRAWMLRTLKHVHVNRLRADRARAASLLPARCRWTVTA